MLNRFWREEETTSHPFICTFVSLLQWQENRITGECADCIAQICVNEMFWSNSNSVFSIVLCKALCLTSRACFHPGFIAHASTSEKWDNEFGLTIRSEWTLLRFQTRNHLGLARFLLNASHTAACGSSAVQPFPSVNYSWEAPLIML